MNFTGKLAFIYSLSEKDTFAIFLLFLIEFIIAVKFSV